jgi:hypothetical protein
MGIFGKILATLNLLLAAGFIWLVSMDYGRRNAWDFQIRQEDFLIQGLPVDDTQQDAEGQRLVDLMGTQMSQQLFTGVQGGQVKSQVAEVKQRHDALVSEISGAAEADKKKRLQEILIPLARSAVERANLRQRILNAKDADLGADGPFLGNDSLFDNAYKDAQGTSTALDHRRGLIAHFLFAVSTTPADYQRTLAVVGLDSYAREVEAQAATLRAMVPQFESLMASDRSAFVAAHQALIREIVTWTERLRRLQDDLTRQETQREQYKTLVAQRERDKDGLEKEIKAAQKSLAGDLKEQGRLEEELVAALKMIAATSAANQRLEQEIKNRELGQ